MGKTEMHISCGEKSRWDWRSGNGHAAHLWYYQRHTGHRWGTYFDSMSLSQNVGCEHKVWNEQYCKWHHEAGCSKKGFGKDVRRMSDQSPFCMKSTPLVISRAFAVVSFQMRVRVRCPVLQVSLPEVYDKMAEINGFTVCSFCLKIYDQSSLSQKGVTRQVRCTCILLHFCGVALSNLACLGSVLFLILKQAHGSGVCWGLASSIRKEHTKKKVSVGQGDCVPWHLDPHHDCCC